MSTAPERPFITDRDPVVAEQVAAIFRAARARRLAAEAEQAKADQPSEAS